MIYEHLECVQLQHVRENKYDTTRNLAYTRVDDRTRYIVA